MIARCFPPMGGVGPHGIGPKGQCLYLGSLPPFFFDTGSHVPQAGLKLTLYLPSTGITGTHQHALLEECPLVENSREVRDLNHLGNSWGF